MSYEQNRKDIQAFFATHFTGVAAGKIAWDNVHFDIPGDLSAWVRLSIQYNNSNYVSTGASQRVRRFGIVFLQIFVAEDTETLLASQIADNAVAVFETRLLNGVVFESPNVTNASNDAGWYQLNIAIPFYFDDIVSKT